MAELTPFGVLKRTHFGVKRGQNGVPMVTQTMVYIGNIWVLDPPHAWIRGAPKGCTQSGPLNRRPPDPLGVQKMSKPDI